MAASFSQKTDPPSGLWRPAESAETSADLIVDGRGSFRRRRFPETDPRYQALELFLPGPRCRSYRLPSPLHCPNLADVGFVKINEPSVENSGRTNRDRTWKRQRDLLLPPPTLPYVSPSFYDVHISTIWLHTRPVYMVHD